jgi:hypothetical protein
MKAVMTLALGAVVLATAAAAAAGGSNPLLKEARLLVAAPIGNGFTAQVWLAPSSSGGQCRFVTKGRSLAAARPRVFGDGGCSVSGPFDALSSVRPLTVGLSISQKPANGTAELWVPPTVNGSVLPKLHATSVRLTWRGGSQALKLRHGSFVGGGSVLHRPPLERLPFAVVAYDAKGKVVAKQELDGASLELMSAAAFAKRYARWAKAHGR